MRAKELLNGVRVRPGRIGGDQRIEKVQESFRSARGESVDRMSDDVRMNMLGKVEADRATARARALRSLSGTVGIPAKSEKRTVTGVESRWICGARV